MVHLVKKKEFKKLCKQERHYIYKIDLDKACFQYNMTYGKYKDLTKRTESDKVLKYIAFEIASIPKYDRYQRGPTSTVYTFF